MAGIASDRPAGLQVSPAAQIGEDINVTPAVQDFMDGFRNGFITVDDINRRAADQIVRPSEVERDVARNEQDTLDQTTIRPLARDVATNDLTEQLSTADLVAALKKKRIANENERLDLESAAQPIVRKQVASAVTRATGTPEEQAAVANDEQKRAVIDQYAQLYGEVPTTLSIPQGITPASFKDWMKNSHGPEVNEHLASIPDSPNKAEIVKGFYDKLSKDPRIQADYQKYRQEVAARTMDVTSADPEYFDHLREKVSAGLEEQSTKAAYKKALPEILVKQLEAAEKRPAEQQKQVSALETDMRGNKILERTRLQMAAVAQIRDLTSKKNPSNQDDIGLIYAVVRALDPASVVREGEVALLQRGAGLPPMLLQQWNRIKGDPNALMTDEIRQNFRSLAETQAKSAGTTALPELRRYYDRAISADVPLNEVFVEPELRLMLGQSWEQPVAPGGKVPATAGGGTVGGSLRFQDGKAYEVQPDGSLKLRGRVQQ